MKIAFKIIYKNYNYYANTKILTFEESKGNNYVFVSVLALYHQNCIFRKEIISFVQI